MRLLLLAMIILTLSATGSAQVSRDLAELADAERAFAAETVKLGFRDGFIKFFADDGIGFGPHPERTREKLLKTPPTTGPRTVIFNWAPMFGDISVAGDLGYTTGPVLFTDVTEDPKPPWHGIYFSVWQKQAGGSWKVAIDMGVDTPSAVATIETKFNSAKLSSRSKDSKRINSEDYRKLDWNLSGTIATESPLGGYDSWLDKEFRIHRAGVMPITERKNLASAITRTKFEFIDGKIARSNDLAFTYGKYATVNVPNAETGYYVHVWRRNQRGEWKLVADIQNPLPKSKD